MLETTQLEQNHSPSNKQVPQRTFAALVTSLLAVLILILVPLVESLHGGVLWGLNYHSPKFMSQVGDALALVKLIALCAGEADRGGASDPQPQTRAPNRSPPARAANTPCRTRSLPPESGFP